MADTNTVFGADVKEGRPPDNPMSSESRSAMSWCDKLGSTPALGLSFDPHFASSSTLLDAATKITDSMVETDGRVRFTIDRQDAFSVTFTSFTGFNYTIDAVKAVVQFQHRMMLRRRSGQPPSMHMYSEPQPYTKLLDIVGARALEVAKLLPHLERRKLTRVGIMSTTAVAEDELPPGIVALVRHTTSGWKGKVAACQMQFTVELNKGESVEDRCICTLARGEAEDDELVTVQLDWQRTFKSGKPSTTRSIDAIVEECKLRALAFFEGIGDGSGFDEKLHCSDVSDV